MGEVVEGSGAAEPLNLVVEERGLAIVWENGKQYEREVVTYTMPCVMMPRPWSAIAERFHTMRCSPSLVMLNFAGPSSPDTYDDMRISPPDLYPKRDKLGHRIYIAKWQAKLREERKQWKFAESIAPKDIALRLTRHYAHMRLYPHKTAGPDWKGEPYPRIHDVDLRLNRWNSDLDNGNTHARASNKAEEIGTEGHPHDCSVIERMTGNPCECREDWRQYTGLRPWQNPPEELVNDWVLRFTSEPDEIPLALTIHLKRILKTFGATYPRDGLKGYKDYPEIPYFQERVEAERRRFQLRSWINGAEQPPTYAKPWELVDFKPKRRGELDSKVKRYLDYTFVKREKPREVKEPGYKQHDSWRDVMAYLGCSRRTAFRKIKEGFRIPKAAAAGR